jgi:hypothetical protein
MKTILGTKQAVIQISAFHVTILTFSKENPNLLILRWLFNDAVSIETI